MTSEEETLVEAVTRLKQQLLVADQHIETREHQILTLCGIVGVGAEEELEAKVRELAVFYVRHAEENFGA